MGGMLLVISCIFMNLFHFGVMQAAIELTIFFTWICADFFLTNKSFNVISEHLE